MAKLISPLMSIDARGKFGDAIVYSIWKGINYARQYFIPSNPNSEDQQAVRAVVSDASKAWKAEATVGAIEIDAEYKAAYAAVAAGQSLSGFNLFMRDCMAINLVQTTGHPVYNGTLEIATAPGILE